MLKVDTTGWPIVIFELRGEQRLDEHQRMLDEWNTLFNRRQKFVVVRVFHDDASTRHSKEIGQLTLKWMNEGAEEAIKIWLEAMLMVVPEASHMKMKNKNVERVFSVPGGIFKSTKEANQWLHDHFGNSFSIPT